MNTHQLAALQYAYDALEPFIDAKTMEIHHSKHHQAYVDNLNKAVSGTQYESMSLEELFLAVKDLPPVIRNNAGGHYNHSLFWDLISVPSIRLSAEQVRIMRDLDYPVAQGDVLDRHPSGELAKAIDRDFGSFDNFKIKFAEAATTRFGSGWAWLIWSEQEQKLKITSTPNQDNPLMQLPEIATGTPVIGLDVWEHAYYLHYQNRRPDYIEAFWKVINWEVANQRYLKKG